MNVCYPLTTQIDYTELRYSLRSIEKYLQPPFDVVIVGDNLPEWINNVTQIGLPDLPGRKQMSIRRKILAALEYAEEILFLNDDLYLLQPTESFPYYWHGYLKNYSESGSQPLFNKLEYLGKPTKHFDGHMPIVYKQDFKEVSKIFAEDCIIKSMYCNYLGIEGTFAGDCKLLRETKPEVIREFIKDKPCFSTGKYSLPSALCILEELFPEPSKYEI